jgi:hypothetical protein
LQRAALGRQEEKVYPGSIQRAEEQGLPATMLMRSRWFLQSLIVVAGFQFKSSQRKWRKGSSVFLVSPAIGLADERF